MLSGLMGATIWSEDNTRLVPFYRDVLGLPVAYEQPGFTGFGHRAPNDAGYTGAYLGIGTHSEVHGPPQEPFRHMVGIETDDVDADYQRLKAAGVEFIEAPGDSGGLRIATLKDPEGNLVQLLQPIVR